MQLVNNYSGGGLNPAQDNANAIEQAVNLAASKTFTQGTVLAQVLGTGSAVAEVQAITPGGTVSGGTWIIVYDGEYTSSLAHNANAATVQAALEALPSIGTGGITVSGGPLTSGAFTLTFAGALAGQAQPLLSVVSSLTGTSPTATVARSTAGKPAGGYWDAYDDAASGSFAGLATARMILKYNCRTNSAGRVFGGTTKNSSDNNESALTAVAYSSGTFATGNGSALVLIGLDANAVTDLGRLISGTTSALTAATTLLRIG